MCRNHGTYEIIAIFGECFMQTFAFVCSCVYVFIECKDVRRAPCKSLAINWHVVVGIYTSVSSLHSPENHIRFFAIVKTVWNECVQWEKKNSKQPDITV